jgi:cytochrome oxidase assembly protein ShyY1
LRRVAVFALGVVVAASCARLGLWQLERLDERREANARFRRGLRAAPVVLDEAPGAGAAYRRASATGVYDRAAGVVLYGRPLEGRPGDHLLVPLRLDDGSAVLVDRGWVPTGTGAATPSGRIRVDGILLPSEPSEGRVLTGGQIRQVDLAAIEATVAYEVAPVYLLLQRQDPPPDRLPVPAAPPELSEGPHLSYAIQWFSFAGVALVGCGVLLRRERSSGDPAG